jgi:hypothetical protein
MKVIKFNITDTEGYEALQSKIHNYLLSKNDVDGFKYSAECWADINDPLKDETHLGVPIYELDPRYTHIYNSLNQAEKDSIETVDNSWGK